MKTTTLALISSLTLGTLGVCAMSAPALAAPPPTVQQQTRPAPQPVQVNGTVTRYFVGPMGHVRGFLLSANGQTLTVPLFGKAGDQMAAAVQPGQAVRVAGLSFGKGQVIGRAQVSTADGKLVAESKGLFGRHGRQGMDPAARQERRQQRMEKLSQLSPYSAAGTIQTVLRGPRGMVHGLLLSDGTTVFLRPQLSRQIDAQALRPGEQVQASGRGGAYPQGASLVAEQITLPGGQTLSAPLPAADAVPSK